MKIVIIGSGNVAQVLTKAFLQAGHSITQMMARNLDVLVNFCEPLAIPYTNDFSQVDTSADVYIIAVSDGAIENVSTQLPIQDKLIVHTAGSVSEKVLQSKTNRSGVFYPLQSISKQVVEVPELSMLIHAAEENDLQLLLDLAKSISEKVSIANDEQRLQYHLAAVITNNFSNHLYAIAYEYCEKNKIDFGALIPMLKEQVNRLENQSPLLTQTGPAIRRDAATIQKHMSMLNDEEQKMYEWFTLSIQKKH